MFHQLKTTFQVTNYCVRVLDILRIGCIVFQMNIKKSS